MTTSAHSARPMSGPTTSNRPERSPTRSHSRRRRRHALIVACLLIFGLFTSANTNATAAAAAQDIAATAVAFRLANEPAANNVKLNWSGVDGAWTYELLRSETEAGEYEAVATTPAATFDDYGLATGRTYFYQVRALDATGETLAYSGPVRASTYLPAGTYRTYDNTRPSSLSLKSKLFADGIYYRYDYQSDANGFTRLVQRTSMDGYTFTGETVVLSRDSDPALAACKLESLHIVKNPATGKFVLWAHYENPTDYTLAQVAVAEAVPGEAFGFIATYRPLGNQSRDLTFFADDATGYVISAANNNADLIIYRLSADWLSIAGQTATLFAGRYREAPAMVHVDGHYYLFTSEAAGWYPSQGQYATATSINGPWSDLRDIGNTATFGAQSGGIVRIGDTYAMMANRWGAQWRYPEPTNSGRLLPISLGEGHATYDYFQSVDYDAEGGTVVPVQDGRILSLNRPVRVSGLSADAAGEGVQYAATKAADGSQSSKDNYYKSDRVPFTVEVDLQQAAVLDHVNLTTKMVNGSETYYSYKLEASLDRKHYTLLAEETGNQIVGFKSHPIANSDTFRYIRVTVTRIVNIQNGNDADWARGVNEIAVFGTPTTDPAPDTVETPTASVAAGTYYAPQTVTLSSPTAGANLYYTTDGTTPSPTNGSPYTSPVEIAASRTLNVVATRAAMVDSPVLALPYVIKEGATPLSLVSGIYAATYTSEQPVLPAQVNVNTADGGIRPANVSWDLAGYSFSAAYRTFTVTGNVENALTVSAQVEVVPRNSVYFIDSGMLTTTPPFAAVKQLVGDQLVNTVADQQSTADGWGFVNDGDAYVGVNGSASTAADKDDTGLWAKGNSGTSRPIIYRLPLPAGTYTVTAGFREWWAGPRQMKVSVVSPAGVTTVLTPNVTVANNAANRTKMTSNQFSISTGGVAQIRVELAGGSEAPVIGWLGIVSGAVTIDTTPIVVNPPTLSVPAGIYKTAQSVALSTTTAGASIYYTTDGSDPSRANGQRYTGPVAVNTSRTIKAIAFNDGTTSTAVEAGYVIEPVPDSYTSVPVGRTWYDTSANPIQAHGGGFLQHDGWYYWVGENKSHNGASFIGVSLYRSQDLKNWEYVKEILTPASSPQLVNVKVERPKLLYNESTSSFVLWGHWETADSYAASHLMVATSATVDGEYTFIRHFRPGVGQVSTDESDPTYTGGGGLWGYGSRDFTVFKDPGSSAAYLVSAQDHLSMRLYPLTADYADVDWADSYPLFENGRREAPALVKAGDRYFVFTSSQSGWYPNQAMYSYTTDIADPTSWSPLQPVGNNTTFYSQPTNIMSIQGTAGTTQYIYMGDRWNPNALGASTYVWLPLTFSTAEGGAPGVTMTYQPSWSFDATTGTVTAPSDRLVSQGKPVEAAAASSQFPPAAANDGNLFNLNSSGDNTNYYLPTDVPFTWTVDLQEPYGLSRIDLSFRSYNGSETYSAYSIDASNDGASWTRLIGALANRTVGFTSNPLTGNYRYVRVSVTKVINDHNGSAATWAAGLVEVQVYAHPTAQTITFGDLPERVYGDADFTINATATSGLPVTLTAAGSCTVTGTTVHVTNAGACTITAHQPGNDTYAPASQVARTFAIATPTLDSFNRPNGAIGNRWDGADPQAFYRIQANQLDVQLGGPLVYDTTFGATQEAKLRLATIDARSPAQGVLLKVQSGSLTNAGAISVTYNASRKAVTVSTLRLGELSFKVYPEVAATFTTGDILSGRVLANGDVQVYRNAQLLATVTLNAADQTFFNSKGGKIGISTLVAPNAVIDDFGGGTIG